ncbi:hypothetical protein [Streptomyces milbemycinicus]|uniref:DUF4261 domain-containing protein n=1 Tax=Streptomyces milbemycinicus TaxID=476552 RepID=A0ABW8M1X7_9ACTN
MDDKIWFIGLPYDDDRDASAPADQQRLAEVLEGQGFRTAPADFGPSLEVWLPDPAEFVASVHLGDSWMVQIAVDECRLAEDFDENRGNTDALAKLIGIVTEFAGTYLGFVTADDDDDLSFMEEDPPVHLGQPLAMVYFGRRYLSGWPDEPERAADPKARWELPTGVLLVPASSPLEINRARPRRFA